MISAWTKHLKDPEDKERFKNSILGSKHVLRRLDEILQEEEGRMDRQESDVNSFSNPSWAYLQAYMNGFRACLKVVRKIINLDQKDTTNELA